MSKHGYEGQLNFDDCPEFMHNLLITAPDGSTFGAVAFLQSWKDAAAENYAAPRPITGTCTS